jgi:hypothetical protein
MLEEVYTEHYEMFTESAGEKESVNHFIIIINNICTYVEYVALKAHLFAEY